jgi:DNA gyrase/topoisomerase IV subunit A
MYDVKYKFNDKHQIAFPIERIQQLQEYHLKKEYAEINNNIDKMNRWDTFKEERAKVVNLYIKQKKKQLNVKRILIWMVAAKSTRVL